MKWKINLLLRLSILFFLIETLLLPDDLRFYGKALPLRNLIIVSIFSMLFPVLYYFKNKWNGALKLTTKKYPFWFDNFYLSMFFLDMMGNSMNMYNRFFYYDLIPHFHSPGVIAILAVGVLNASVVAAVGLANIAHILFEGIEYYADIVFQTHNVRGAFDTVNDLLTGLVGASVYAYFFLFLQKRKLKK